MLSSVEGFLIVDKPIGMSSHDVVNRVRRVCGIRKVGHAGTLDPLATGVLVVAVGRATRLIEYLMHHSKRYEATIRLGETTTTYDAEGEVLLKRPFTHLTPTQIETTLSHFRGAIQQQPPMYSAIKKDGQPLYKLARKGIVVKRPLRNITIHQLDLVDCSLPDIKINVHSSTGTYIRSLAYDIGEQLDCGAHIVQLRRTSVGELGIETAVSLDVLTRENISDHLLAADMAILHIPRLNVSEKNAQRLLLGQPIAHQATQPAEPLARAYAESGRFLGMVKCSETGWKAHKMFTQQGS